MENTEQNNLLQTIPLDLGSNFGSSPHLKDIFFMQNHTVLPDTGLSRGADVVLGLKEKYEVKAGSTVTFHNFLPHSYC